MPISVCLRIVPGINYNKLVKLEALGPLVTKVTDAFLETHWAAPKHHKTLSPFSVMLTDPESGEINVVHLQRLAEALRLRLFGANESGEVTLLLFDGDEADTARFSRMDHADLAKAVREPLGPTPFGGRLLKVGAAADAAAETGWRMLEREGAPASRPRPEAGAVKATYRGIYFRPRESFVGSSVSAHAPDGRSRYSLVDGEDALPGEDGAAYDLACLAAGQRHLLAHPFTGVLFVPFRYSAVMRRSTREAYQLQLGEPPATPNHQLAAVVYGVPHAPPVRALEAIRGLLGQYVATIDLQIDDVDFDIDHLPPYTFNSITYRLPTGDERQRIAALKRFMGRREIYKRRKTWAAITNVRTPAELRACLFERVPFLTGAAVCGATRLPVGSLPWEAAQLPKTGTAADG